MSTAHCLVIAVLLFALADGVAAAQGVQGPTPTGDKTGLIPRKVLFDNPDRSAARISPDGKQLSYLAPVNGVMNVWVAPIDKAEEAKAVTQDKVRGIRAYLWAYTSQHLLYIQDKGGDENWHVYCVDLKMGETKDLTPIKGVNAKIEGVSPKFPNEMLIGLNDRSAKFHDIHRVDLLNGERKLIQKNDEFTGFLTDDDFQVRFAYKFTADGGQLTLKADGKGGWTEFMKTPMADSLTTRPAGFDKLYLPLETVNANMQKKWDRTHTNMDKFFYALQNAVDAGYKLRCQDINCFILFGLPDEDLQAVYDTVVFASSRVGSVIPMLFTPVPSTPMFDTYKGYLEDKGFDLQHLNGKLLPFLDFNRSKYKGLSVRDYFALEGLMWRLNAKVRAESFNLGGKGRVAQSFRSILSSYSCNSPSAPG